MVRMLCKTLKPLTVEGVEMDAIKSFYQANQATNQIHKFLDMVSNIPSSLYDIYEAHILICGDKPIIPLFPRLYEVQDDLCAAFEAASDDIKLVDYYICSHALSSLHKNILNRIRGFISNNRDKLFMSKPEDVSDAEYVEYLEYSFLDNYEGFYRSGEDKEYVVSILRRFRYRSSVYDIVKRLLPASEVEAIESDYLFNFYRYKKDFYKYYHEFYTKNKGYDPEISKMLLLYSKENDYNYEDIKPYKITFDVDMYKPIEHILEELDDFRNAVYLMMPDTLGSNEFRADSTSRFGFHYLKDYFRQSGKLEERNNISELFRRWHRYLEIYDLMDSYDKDKLSKTTRAINNQLPDNTTKKVAATVKNEYDEAVRLIESAAKGTFPY